MLVQTYNSCNDFINDDESILLIKNNEIESLYGYIENPSGASVFLINPKDFDIFSSVNMVQAMNVRQVPIMTLLDC